MNQYLILLQGKGALDYSEKELNKRMQEYKTWVETIGEHYVSDARLENKGAHIKSKKEVLTDGPFLEMKEIIAGFIVIQASNFDEGLALVKSLPLLQYFEAYLRPIVQ